MTTESGNAVLIFSSVNYATQEVNVDNKSVINVVLKQSGGELDEVVVTALGIKRAPRSLAYNVQTLGNKDITGVNDANLASALVGKIAGATVNASASGVGGSVRMVLRGTKSITGNNNALYVVDGIPMPNLFSSQPSGTFGGSSDKGEGISNFNPDDVESMSVLSGASAAALYGYEAQNGVILITTKKGNKGKTRVNFSTGVTFASPFVLPKLQTTYGTLPSTATVRNALSWGEKLSTPSSYNVKDFFETGTTFNNSVNVSTGSERSQTYFSAAALNGKGIIHNNKYNRYNFTIRNTSILIPEKLDMDVSAMYMTDTRQNPPGQGQYNNPLVSLYLFPPADVDNPDYTLTNYEKYDPIRKFNTQNWGYGELDLRAQNPYWITNREFFKTDRSRFMGTVALKYSINENLNLTGRVKYDEANDKSSTKLYAGTNTALAGGQNGYFSYGTSNAKQTYADLMLNYNRQLNDFDLKVVLGSSLKHDGSSGVSVAGPLAVVPNFFHVSNVARENVAPSNTIPRHQENQAIFGSADLGYKNQLFLTLTARNDWNSALAYTSTNSIFYPSVGLSAIVSDMLKLPSFISFAKIRGSYSQVGNPPQRYLAYPEPVLSAGQLQVVTTAPFNIKPEKTKSLEAGIDLRFIQNKLNLSVTYYNTNTINQIFSAQIPAGASLYNSYSINAGKINNHGIEAVLGYNGNFSDLSWNSNLTFSLNRNEIKELLEPQLNPFTGVIDGQDTITQGGASQYAQWLVKGGSTGAIYTNGLRLNPDGTLFTTTNNEGDLIPQRSDSSRLVGNSNPMYNIGFNNGFSYKGFTLNFTVAARFGGEVVSGTQALLDYYGVSEATATTRDNGGVTAHGVTFPNVQAYYQTISQPGGGGLSGIALSEYVYSATNVRLSEASLGYRFQKALFNNIIKNLEVNVIGRNLLMIYNKAPFDPELAASTSTFFQGYDFFNQPSQRYLGVKLNLNF